MARRRGPQIKLSRRFGQPLFFSQKEAKILQRRGYPPGQHGESGGGRLSGYGLQLREKQKAKIMYGLLERQFRKYFEEVRRRTGNTGEMLLQNLECRLDNVIYRLGLAATRAQGRQLVSHGHILVNGRRVNIPSYRLAVGDLVTLRLTSRQKTYFSGVAKSIENHQPPAWLELDKTKLEGKVLSRPSVTDLERQLQPQLIVEFYSR